jgi:hypothetical protein
MTNGHFSKKSLYRVVAIAIAGCGPVSTMIMKSLKPKNKNRIASTNYKFIVANRMVTELNGSYKIW